MRFVILIFFVVLQPVNAEIYQWEENGEVVYSDDPNHKDAKKKEVLPEITEYKALPAKSVAMPTNRSQADTSRYELTVVSPEADQTITGNTGNVKLEFTAKPHLVSHAGHRIEYQIAGQTKTISGLAAMLSNMDRGSHTLTARVVDSEGHVLSNTVTTTFYVKRNSVFIKKNLKKNNMLAPQAK